MKTQERDALLLNQEVKYSDVYSYLVEFQFTCITWISVKETKKKSINLNRPKFLLRWTFGPAAGS